MLTRLFIFFISLVLASLACAQEKDITTIRPGLKVEVKLPTGVLENAAIDRFFNPDSLLIKRKDRSYISLTPMNREMLALSDDFNLSDYPKYVLAVSDLNAASNLNSSDLENLKQARTVWQNDEHDPIEVSVHEQNTGTLYARCEKSLCHNFFVEYAQNEEIILVEVYQMDNEVLLRALGGGPKK